MKVLLVVVYKCPEIYSSLVSVENIYNFGKNIAFFWHDVLKFSPMILSVILLVKSQFNKFIFVSLIFEKFDSMNSSDSVLCMNSRKAILMLP